MKISKCSNGHFFDSETYSQCPHCGAQAANQQGTIQPVQKKTKRGLFGKKNKETNSAQQQGAFGIGSFNSTQEPRIYDGGNPYGMNGMESRVNHGGGNPYGANVGSSSGHFGQTIVIDQQNNHGFDDGETSILSTQQNTPAQIYADKSNNQGDKPDCVYPMFDNTLSYSGHPIVDNEKTMSFWNGGLSPQMPESEKNFEDRREGHFSHEPYDVKAENADDHRSGAHGYGDSELHNAVRQASAFSEGMTMSFFQSKTANASNTNDSEDSGVQSVHKTQSEPTVGWLVCVKGDHFGMSFAICAGTNSIGRNSGNRIILSKSNTVSRSKHALITFEPRQKAFYIKPGESSGLTYLNGEYITDVKVINDRDIVELGNNSLMLVALCGESFSWEDYMADR